MLNPSSNHPRGMRGAFVEYSYGPPTLVVPFQFNPAQLARSRSLDFSVPGEDQKDRRASSQNALRKQHQQQDDLMKLYEAQQVEVQEESINFEIRLDATDRLDEGDEIAAQLGVAPQLAILEQMVYPRSETLLGEILGKLSDQGFSYTQGDKPPLVLFVWGSRWVLPVNIKSLTITESEFNVLLYPWRVTVAVALTVIEGQNAPFKYSLRAREALAAQGMASGIQVADIVIPG